MVEMKGEAFEAHPCGGDYEPLISSTVTQKIGQDLQPVFCLKNRVSKIASPLAHLFHKAGITLLSCHLSDTETQAC